MRRIADENRSIPINNDSVMTDHRNLMTQNNTHEMDIDTQQNTNKSKMKGINN